MIPVKERELEVQMKQRCTQTQQGITKGEPNPKEAGEV